MSDHDDRTRAFGWLLLGLTLLGLAVRVAYLLLEPRCALSGDEPSWVATGVLELGRPNRGLPPLRNRLIFYPPVYAYFVALLYRGFGSIQAVLWAQTLLGALLVPIVGRIGRLACGARVGLVAAALAALYPDLVWYSAHFWSETVFLLLLWWGIERALVADVRRSGRVAVAAGVLFGLATLTRELALYLVPLVALWMLRDPLRQLLLSLRRLRLPARAVLWPAAVAPLALSVSTALTVAPWTVRNAIVVRAFVPVSTMGGLNLWQGNTRLTHLEIYELLKTKGGAVEQDRFCRAMAWQTIAARQPGWLYEKLVEQMPEFWKAGAEALDHYIGREACGRLSDGTLLALEAGFVAPYLVVFGLFLLGLARLRPNAPLALLLGLLAAYNGAHVVAYATTRFRLPVLPVVFVVAAGACLGAQSGVNARLTRGRAVLLVILLLLALATLAPGMEELLAWRRITAALGA